MNIECSWCGHVMVPGVPPTSHGICDPCARKARAEQQEGRHAFVYGICGKCRDCGTTPENAIHFREAK